MRKRYTYSLPNAMRFKPLFDKAIATQKNYKLSIKGSPSAFQTKISDALKWLIEHHDQEHIDCEGRTHNQGEYAMLRGKCKLKLGLGELILAFYHNDGSKYFDYTEVNISDPANVAKLRGNPRSNFKEKVIEWATTDAQIGETLRMIELNLDEEEQAWARNFLSQIPHITFDVDEQQILAKIEKPAGKE